MLRLLRTLTFLAFKMNIPDFTDMELCKNDVFSFHIPINQELLQKVKDDILGNVVNFNFFVL